MRRALLSLYKSWPCVMTWPGWPRIGASRVKKALDQNALHNPRTPCCYHVSTPTKATRAPDQRNTQRKCFTEQVDCNSFFLQTEEEKTNNFRRQLFHRNHRFLSDLGDTHRAVADTQNSSEYLVWRSFTGKQTTSNSRPWRPKPNNSGSGQVHTGSGVVRRVAARDNGRRVASDTGCVLPLCGYGVAYNYAAPLNCARMQRTMHPV